MSKPRTSFLRLHRAPCGAQPRPVGVADGVSQQDVVSELYSYLLNRWAELPDESKRALGFDFVVGSESEQVALNRLASTFLDYADLSLKRALIARRRRLGFESTPATTH